MLTLQVENRFKKDIKKLRRAGSYDFSELNNVIDKLVNKKNLPAKYKNHILIGKLKGYFDCHIKDNWVLLYKLTDEELILVRTGTHADVLGL
jgi:mRNA interferase YafQ